MMGQNVLESGKNQTKIEVNPCICDTHFVCDDCQNFRNEVCFSLKRGSRFLTDCTTSSPMTRRKKQRHFLRNSRSL